MNCLNNNKLIKLQHNNQFRKFRVEESINFAQFSHLVQTILQIDVKEYQLCYFDEGSDEVVFSSDIELSSALSSSLSPLRIFLKSINNNNNNTINNNNDNNNDNNNNLNNNKDENEEDKKSKEEIKQKAREINDKINIIKDEIRQIKQQKKEKKGKQIKGEENITENNEKDQKMALFNHSLAIYELKSQRRSLFQQMKSFNRANQILLNEKGEKNELRKSIWELNKKVKGIKVQIRSVKLLFNDNSSDQQRSDLHDQICDLKKQLIQLKEEKINLCSQFRNNKINNNGTGKGCGKPQQNFTHIHEREEMKNDFIDRRKQMIALRKRIVKIKSTTNFQNDDQLRNEIQSLKDQIQLLTAKKYPHDKSHAHPHFHVHPHHNRCLRNSAYKK